MKRLSLLLSLLFFLHTLDAQQDFSKVEIKTVKLTDQIYMLQGSGGNIGVFKGDDAVLMIDDQFAPLGDKIKAAIKALSDQPVKYLVNTHWHGDHTGGNENFGAGGSIIIAQENVRARLSTEQFNRTFNQTIPPSPEAAWPELTFTEDMQVHINGQEVVLLHVHNAHTDGDTFVWFPQSNVLHTGDCFFKDKFPYIDLGSGGTVDGAIKAVQAALMLADDATKIIPGHGDLANKTDLLNYHRMLVTMRDRVKSAMAEGKSIEVIKASGLDNGYEDWGTGFISSDRMVDILWTDLTKGL